MQPHDLFVTQSARRRFDRIIVQAALVGSAAAAVLLVVIGFVLGTEAATVWLETTPPAFAAAVFALLWVTGRDRAETVLILAAVIAIVAQALTGVPETAIAAGLAIVATLAFVSWLLERRQVWYLLCGVAINLAVPHLWATWPPSAPSIAQNGIASLSLTMAVMFAVLSVAMILIRNTAGQVANRYLMLFDAAPVGMIEQDWTSALQHIQDLDVRTESELRDRLAADPDLIGRILRDVVFVRANHEAARLVDLSSPEGFGNRIPDVLIPPETYEGWIPDIVSFWKGEDFADAEYNQPSVTGRKTWVTVQAVVLDDAARRNVLVAISDITRQVQAREELADLVRAKDQFIASVSHELRTPLTAILGLAITLKENTRLEGEEYELLDIIQGQSQEMAYIVEDLLVAARSEIGTIVLKTGPTRPVEVIHDVLRELGIECDVRFSGPDAQRSVALTDRMRAKQVIRNLLVNALRHGGERQWIEVETDDQWVRVIVGDTGDAIPAEDRDRIFEPYQRAHHTEGSPASVGLGLAVSRDLARMMGGDIVYRFDQASTFVFTLPRGERPSEAM